jgi:hypothetical protein
MDTALRARRRTAGPGGGASPYAKPTKQGKEGGCYLRSIFFFGIQSLIYIFSCLTHTPLILLFPTHTHPSLYYSPHPHTHAHARHSLTYRRHRNTRE